MLIEFDTAKRQKTLDERGLDFCDAPQVFQGTHFTASDDRMNYGEPRFFSIGSLHDRVWWWFGQSQNNFHEVCK
jgi:uncharacterized DUF497 family protein